MKYSGILRIGFKLLVNDRGKFSALLIGITFAVFLMMEMTAMFAGIMNRAYSTVTNIGAEMWVMDPAVNTATNAIPLPDYLLDAVRSIDGVHDAVPLFMGGALVKLEDGTYQAVNVVGLDDSSLFGRPALEQGNIQDIYNDNTLSGNLSIISHTGVVSFPPLSVAHGCTDLSIFTCPVPTTTTAATTTTTAIT